MISTLRNRNTTFFKNNIKNTLRTFEDQNGENFKNIEPRPKITGSYKKERVCSLNK